MGGGGKGGRPRGSSAASAAAAGDGDGKAAAAGAAKRRGSYRANDKEKVWVVKGEPSVTKSSSTKLPLPPKDFTPPARRRRMVGFDFDCTLTVRHFYKVFAWGYAAQSDFHSHYKAFAGWCEERGVDPKMEGGGFSDSLMMDALQDFTEQAGPDAFRSVFREVFLGGNQRIQEVAASLEQMSRRGVDFAIITAGISASVVRALAEVPEWLPFFSTARIWDISQCRHNIQSVAGRKAFILRDLAPDACRVMLVDDALCRDPIPEWVQKATGVLDFELPYEGPGVDAESLEAIAKQIMA